MKIPKKIHWNGQTFVVKYVPNLDGGDSWGKTSLSSLEIHLENQMHQQKKEQTFIHELLHITFRGSGLDWKNDEEERAVKTWAINIYGMLKDNDLLK